MTTTALFAEWLRTQMRVHKVSQRTLAQRSGVDHATISRILRYDRTPRMTTAAKLFQAFGEDSFMPTSTHPITRVARALRSDPSLEERHVEEVMIAYHLVRARAQKEQDPFEVEKVS